jgi:hypothetical protein
MQADKCSAIVRFVLIAPDRERGLVPAFRPIRPHACHLGGGRIGRVHCLGGTYLPIRTQVAVNTLLHNRNRNPGGNPGLPAKRRALAPPTT